MAEELKNTKTIQSQFNKNYFLGYWVVNNVAKAKSAARKERKAALKAPAENDIHDHAMIITFVCIQHCATAYIYIYTYYIILYYVCIYIYNYIHIFWDSMHMIVVYLLEALHNVYNNPKKKKNNGTFFPGCYI